MKRYILTGTPGSGKTTLLESLARLGYTTVPESATALIEASQARGSLRPWEEAGFVDAIAEDQMRLMQAAYGELAFFDRSPVCTLALAHYLGDPVSKGLQRTIEAIQRDGAYERRVFFIENLGCIENTDARKISFEEALRFEKLHVTCYEEAGFELVRIPKGPVAERLDNILNVTD